MTAFGSRVDVYGPRPIATGRLDQDPRSQLLTYIRLLYAARQRLRREPRWIFRALPPHRPRDIGRSHTGPHTRFGKRRNDRFIISCHFAAIAGRDLLLLFLRLPFHLKLFSPTVRARRMCRPRAWPTRSSQSCWRARQPRDIGMPPLPQLPKPEASGVLLAGCFAEHSARALCAPRNDERLKIHHHVIALDRYGDGLGDIRSLHHGSTGLDIDRIGAGAEALRVAIGLAGADVEFPAVPGAADD